MMSLDNSLEKIGVSVIVSTKNEEIALPSCLESLTAFAEVFVVDSLSTDATTKIARRYGANVVEFNWDGKYPKKKQWCLDNLIFTFEWVLFIDADETPTQALVEEIRHIVDSHETRVAFDIPLQYHFMGRKLRHGHTVKKRALIRSNAVRFPVLDDLRAPGMGELEGHYQPIADGEVGAATAKLRHSDPDPIGTWVTRHNKYSDWEAYLRSQDGLARSVGQHRSRQGRIFDRVPGKPLAFFVYCYFLKLGFLDGREGLYYAVSLTWYYWLISVKTAEARKMHQ